MVDQSATESQLQGLAQDGQSMAKVKDEIISGELADVILLLDYLSGRSDRSIAGLSIDVDRKDLVSAVFSAHWPPLKGESDTQIADAATIMFKARDQLNELAYPATGASIAFTILSTGEDASLSGELSGKIKTTRQGLAARAYPRFLLPALQFRKFRSGVFYFLLLILIVTSVLSWHVATGQFFLNTISSSDDKFVGLLPEFYAIQQGTGAPPLSSQGPPDFCTEAAAEVSVERLRLCTQLSGLRKARCNASFSLGLWYTHFPWNLINTLLIGMSPPDLEPTTAKKASSPPYSRRVRDSLAGVA